MIHLRDYQQEAVNSVFDYISKGRGNNPLVVAPTGAGKSIIMAEICRHLVTSYEGVRILNLTHVKELISQNCLKFHELYPECNTGIYSASFNRKDTLQNVLFAGIQSIDTAIHKFEPFDIVIIDEAHMIPKRADTRYGRVRDTLLLMNPKTKFIGLTATPYRLDSGRLYGKGCLFDGISYDIEISYLIENGYLCNVITKGGVQKIDLTSVKKRGGEYLESDLNKAASKKDLVESVVSEIIEYGKDRRAWLVFASGLSHAELLKEEFLNNGITSVEVLTGKTPKIERDKITNNFKNGNLKCLINIGVLTTGFDAPICDLVAMVRATLSTGLYVQIVGRGMRLYPGKENCLFLDYGNNVIEHGPIDAIPTKRAKSESTEPGEAPMKECRNCHEIVHASKKECPECGFKFPDNSEVNHDFQAYDGAILSSQIKPQVFKVTDVTYNRHVKMGKKDSLKVSYWSYLKIFNEWVCVEHFGMAGEKARKQIKEMGGSAKTVTEALIEKSVYRKPKEIHAVKSGKYWKIIKKVY